MLEALKKRFNLPVGVVGLAVILSLFSTLTWEHHVFGLVLLVAVVGTVAVYGWQEAAYAKANFSGGITGDQAKSFAKRRMSMPVWAVLLLVIAALPFAWTLFKIAVWLLVMVVIVSLFAAVFFYLASRLNR